MGTSNYFPAIEDIQNASGTLAEILEATPFQRNNNLSDAYDAEVYLKREDLQMVRLLSQKLMHNQVK